MIYFLNSISFKNKETEKVFTRSFSKKLPNEIQSIAYRKLFIIDNAETIRDLKMPPANNLEKLKGKIKNKYSIRINKQWRICFKWIENNAQEVEIVDYH